MTVMERGSNTSTRGRRCPPSSPKMYTLGLVGSLWSTVAVAAESVAEAVSFRMRTPVSVSYTHLTLPTICSV